MRNGNIATASLFSDPSFGLKPTYEEWKLHFRIRSAGGGFGLKPTYEEWKQFPGPVGEPVVLGLKPTYKEWKLKKDERIGQVIFKKYLIIDDDDSEGERLGGHGSTGV